MRISLHYQIFNFQKAYFILDELLLAGEMQESSKKNVLRVISAQDSIEDTEVSRVLLAFWFMLALDPISTIPLSLKHWHIFPLSQVDEEVTKIMWSAVFYACMKKYATGGWSLALRKWTTWIHLQFIFCLLLTRICLTIRTKKELRIIWRNLALFEAAILAIWNIGSFSEFGGTENPLA